VLVKNGICIISLASFVKKNSEQKQKTFLMNKSEFCMTETKALKMQWFQPRGKLPWDDKIFKHFFYGNLP
jgi:hypothetical protein